MFKNCWNARQADHANSILETGRSADSNYQDSGRCIPCLRASLPRNPRASEFGPAAAQDDGCCGLLGKLKARSAQQPTIEDPAPAQSLDDCHGLADPEGYFYFLTPDGNLHRYDPTIDEIIKTGLSNVDKIKLGADMSVYACMNDRVVRLGQDGFISDGGIFDGNVRDVAVSSNGSDLFFLGEGEQLYHCDIKSENPCARFMPMPIPNYRLQSVATSVDGGVWLLGADGNVHRGQISKEGNTKIENWSNKGSPSEQLVSLETLPDGTVAGRDITGRFVRPTNSQSWEEVAFESLSKTSFQNFHENLNAPNGLEITTLGGCIANTESAKSKSGTTKPNQHNLFDSLKEKYKYLSHFGYEKQLPPRSFKRYATQVGNYEGILFSTITNSVSNETRELIEELGWDTKEKTEKFLDELESSPRTSQDNSAHTSGSAKILQQIKSIRESMYGENDAVARKLDHAINEGWIVDIKCSVKLAELLAEYAIIANTVKKLTDIGPSEDNNYEARLNILNQAVIDRNESLPHLVSRSGVSETDLLGNAAQGFDALQNIFQKKTDILASIVRKIAESTGMEPPETASISEMSDLFQKFVSSMKPGSSITMGKSKDRGYNTEFLCLVVAGAAAALTAGSVVAWGIPMVDIGKERDVNLSITKTDDGIAVEILHSRAKYKQFGGRAGVGIMGVSDMGAKGAGWGLGAYEATLKLKHTNNNADCIKFTFKDKGDGNIGALVADILSGNADIFRLMKLSEEFVSTHKQEKIKNLSFANVLAGAACTEQPGWKSIMPDAQGRPEGPVGKVMGVVGPELVFNWEGKKMSSDSTSSSGNVTKEKGVQKFGFKSIRGNLVSVGALVADWLKFPVGQNNEYSAAGRAILPSVLPGIMLSKSWEGFSANSKTSVLIRSGDGKPRNISVNLTVTNTRKIDPSGQLVKKVPGLQKALKKLAKQNGPISIEMELKPELVSTLPADDNQRINCMKELAKSVSNFRITRISTSNTRKAQRNLSLCVPLLTRTNSGKVEATIPSAGIDFIYGKENLIDHAESLLKTMVSFDGIWGTKAREERLTALTGQLANLVEALGQEVTDRPLDDRLKEYNKQLRGLKANFMRNVNSLLTQKMSLQSLNMRESLEKIYKLKKRLMFLMSEEYRIPDFEGPAILASGTLFVKPDVGHGSSNIKVDRYAEVPAKVRGALERLRGVHLSSVPGSKLKKAKEKAFKDIDVIVRTVNAMTNVDEEKKKELFIELPLLSYRSSDNEQFDKVARMLEDLMCK